MKKSNPRTKLSTWALIIAAFLGYILLSCVFFSVNIWRINKSINTFMNLLEDNEESAVTTQTTNTTTKEDSKIDFTSSIYQNMIIAHTEAVMDTKQPIIFYTLDKVDQSQVTIAWNGTKEVKYDIKIQQVNTSDVKLTSNNMIAVTDLGIEKLWEVQITPKEKWELNDASKCIVNDGYDQIDMDKCSIDVELSEFPDTYSHFSASLVNKLVVLPDLPKIDDKYLLTYEDSFDIKVCPTIDINTFDPKYITIKDENGNIIDGVSVAIDNSYGTGGQCTYIVVNYAFENKKSYGLIVQKGLKSLYGAELQEDVVYKFSTDIQYEDAYITVGNTWTGGSFSYLGRFIAKNDKTIDFNIYSHGHGSTTGKVTVLKVNNLSSELLNYLNEDCDVTEEVQYNYIKDLTKQFDIVYEKNIKLPGGQTFSVNISNLQNGFYLSVVINEDGNLEDLRLWAITDNNMVIQVNNSSLLLWEYNKNAQSVKKASVSCYRMREKEVMPISIINGLGSYHVPVGNELWSTRNEVFVCYDSKTFALAVYDGVQGLQSTLDDTIEYNGRYNIILNIDKSTYKVEDTVYFDMRLVDNYSSKTNFDGWKVKVMLQKNYTNEIVDTWTGKLDDLGLANGKLTVKYYVPDLEIVVTITDDKNNQIESSSMSLVIEKDLDELYDFEYVVQTEVEKVVSGENIPVEIEFSGKKYDTYIGHIEASFYDKDLSEIDYYFSTPSFVWYSYDYTKALEDVYTNISRFVITQDDIKDGKAIIYAPTPNVRFAVPLSAYYSVYIDKACTSNGECTNVSFPEFVIVKGTDVRVTIMPYIMIAQSSSGDMYLLDSSSNSIMSNVKIEQIEKSYSLSEDISIPNDASNPKVLNSFYTVADSTGAFAKLKELGSCYDAKISVDNHEVFIKARDQSEKCCNKYHDSYYCYAPPDYWIESSDCFNTRKERNLSSAVGIDNNNVVITLDCANGVTPLYGWVVATTGGQVVFSRVEKVSNNCTITMPINLLHQSGDNIGDANDFKLSYVMLNVYLVGRQNGKLQSYVYKNFMEVSKADDANNVLNSTNIQSHNISNDNIEFDIDLSSNNAEYSVYVIGGGFLFNSTNASSYATSPVTVINESNLLYKYVHYMQINDSLWIMQPNKDCEFYVGTMCMSASDFTDNTWANMHSVSLSGGYNSTTLFYKHIDSNDKSNTLHIEVPNDKDYKSVWVLVWINSQDVSTWKVYQYTK